MNRNPASLTSAATWLTRMPGHGMSALFRSIARLRHAPAVHPRGVPFSARLTVSDHTPLIPQGSYLTTVNLSKGCRYAGAMARRPRLGPAIHSLSTAEPCDFLFSSAGDGQWTRWLPVPARDWAGTSYGTLAPYESAGRWWRLMLTPSDAPVGHASIRELEQSAPLSFTLYISRESADWHQVGQLSLHQRLDKTGLVFDPVINHPDAGVPAPGWLHELRERAYTGSRQGRNALPWRLTQPL